jgi:hypothetical protein
MTEHYVTDQIWFPCESCGKQITHHSMHTCFVMNPDILPNLEEWRLICKMVKQKQAEIEALKKEIEDDEWTKDKLILKAKKRIMHDFNNVLIEIQKTSDR